MKYSLLFLSLICSLCFGQGATIVVTTTPGATPDIVARTFARTLSTVLGEPVIVENKPGANGRIGATYAASEKSPNTLLMMTIDSATINYTTYPDFAPVVDSLKLISVLSVSPGFVMLVPANGLHRDWLSLLKYARVHETTYSIPGVASGQHMANLLLQKATGAKLLDIPYVGGPAAVKAVMAGEVDYTITTMGTAKPALATGKVIAVATTYSGSGLPVLPIDVYGWYMLYSTSHTSTRLRKAAAQAAAQFITSPEGAALYRLIDNIPPVIPVQEAEKILQAERLRVREFVPLFTGK